MSRHIGQERIVREGGQGVLSELSTGQRGAQFSGHQQRRELGLAVITAVDLDCKHPTGYAFRLSTINKLEANSKGQVGSSSVQSGCVTPLVAEQQLLVQWFFCVCVPSSAAVLCNSSPNPKVM